MKFFITKLVSALAFILIASSSPAATRMEAVLLDDATGTPLAARVAITNAHGKFVEIDGSHPHVEYLGKRWCYVENSFSLTLPESGAGIEIRRGFETRPLFVAMPPQPDTSTCRHTFRLRRWVDLADRGYISGDIHAHLPIPAEALPQMKAEDLDFLSLLYLANSAYELPLNQHFTGRLDTNSTKHCQIRVDQEISDFQMGHLTLLNLTNLVQGYDDIGGSLEYWRSQPHWNLLPAIRAARAQGGIVLWSHICSLPGEQLPIAIAHNLLDGIELVTWNDPTEFPNHWGPWLNSGMPQAEFPIMSSLNLFYQFLNAGFRLPAAAGTDKFGEEIPLGSNRTFARVKSPCNYHSWVSAVKEGRTFVSNGPILDFEVDEKLPGDVVHFSGRRKVDATVTAQSTLPFTTLEVVLNGEPIAHKTMPIYSNAPVDGVYTMQVAATIEISRSSWLAARVVDHPDLRNRILPRNLSVFAHTSPIYFLKDGGPVRERPSIAYLTKYVQGVLHWLESEPKFVHEEDLHAARRDAKSALRIFRKLKSESLHRNARRQTGLHRPN